MKINQPVNPLHSIRQMETVERKKADLPRQITQEVADAQQPDISALFRQSPLLNDLQTLLNSAGQPSSLSRKSVIEYSVDKIMDTHLSAGMLTDKARLEMRQTITDYIQQDPQLSRRFDSILQRLSTLNSVQDR